MQRTDRSQVLRPCPMLVASGPQRRNPRRATHLQPAASIELVSTFLQAFLLILQPWCSPPDRRRAALPADHSPAPSTVRISISSYRPSWGTPGRSAVDGLWR